MMTPKLELPKGGGAIRAIGEKLEAAAFTGAASFTIPIAMSPGRGGTGPRLALSYSSGAGNGLFGTGWTLGIPSITRKTERELPQYADERESDTFLLAGAEDLVPVLDIGGERVIHEREEHRVYPYRPRVEGLFARIERWVRRSDGDTHWRVITRDNTTSWYGRDALARIADPDDPLRVFSWLLEQTDDDRGNVTRYVYKPDDANRCLKRVLYGNRAPFEAAGWMFEAVLDYGEHGQTPAEEGPWPARDDAFSSFRAGFEVRTRRLCRRVLMFHHFETSTLVRSTDLEYSEQPHLAKLVRVTQRSYEPADGGYVSAAMPPIELAYTEARLQPELHEIDTYDMPSDHSLVDLDGEGLPGIVAQIGENLHYKTLQGSGRFGALRTLPVQATAVMLGRGGQLVDLDGDGRPELASPDGFHSRAANGDWAAYTDFAQVTTLDPADPNVRQIDLDASGLPDLLVSHDDHFVWVPSLGPGGYGPARLIQKPGDERSGPAVVFNDPSGTLFVADMTGDGLQDIVRFGSGAVHYWPNLGRGRFGRRVTMADAPVFTDFDPRRIRLADIDGSGTTDVIYLDHHGARAWFNLSGNGFSAESPVRPFPGVSDTTSIEVTDLLGKGTACLMWSEPGRMLYLDLMGDKPHLLVSVVDNMGLETRIHYEPSTFQYLRDRAAGRPWLTRLPFPVYVATRIEHYDAVARRRSVQRSSYHHGHYDAVEREFHGFARIERWDTESFADFHSGGLFSLELFDGVEEDLHQPPVHTRSWFHTGAYFGASRISRQLADEYWPGDPQAWQLPDTVLPAELSPAESREAVRALKGRLLRSEIYALDGTEAASVPYTVAETNFTVRLIQPQGPGKHAVLFTHDREALSYHYERDAADPRVTHGLVLEVDDHGNVTRSAAVSYPRRVTPADLAEQGQRSVVYTEAAFAALETPDAYRAGVPVSNRTFEVSGLEEALPWRLDTMLAAIDAAPAMRLLTASRALYYTDDLSGPLPLGACGIRALAYAAHSAAFSDEQRDTVFGNEAPDELLTGEGGYLHDEQLWWIRSPRQEFDPARFWAPVRVFDAFGNPPSQIAYDEPNLFPVRVTDPMGNVVSADHDYRVLAPRLVTDPNGGRSGVTFDTRGMVVATFLMGAAGSGLGDSAIDPTATLDYDLFAWHERGEPNFVHSRTRETHADPQTRWIEKYTYSDGSGNVSLEKVTAEPDPEGASRWVGSGRTFFDNKANPIKQYEPYFSATPAYEAEAEFREQGVTPILHYDPLGRLIRTDLPNGTFTRTRFTPWTRLEFDPNDTVLDSDWFGARADGALGPQEQRAAQVTQPHANTPTTTHLDHLGRVIRVVEDAGSEQHTTRLVLDVQGNVLQVVDARGNPAETRIHGMLGQTLATSSADTGWRRSLNDTTGNPLRSWNERGFTARVAYDAMRRATHHFVTPAGQAEILVTRTIWGEEAGLDGLNLRTRVHRVLDGAGETLNEEYDFKGNLLRQSRLMSGETFTVTTQYDALNRVVSRTTPDDSVTLFGYNEAGLVDSVDARLRGAVAATSFVSDVDYNARGQRERCVHGNGTQSGYEYDPLTFRLTRLRLTRASDSALLQDLRYTYDPAGNITEIRDGAQQTVFFAGSVVTADQQFEYDPRYRLIHATGREHASLGQSAHGDVAFGPQRHPDDPAALRRYREDYTWDRAGNLLALRHTADGGGFTRRYEYSEGGNRLLATSAPGQAAPPFSHLYTYDAHGNMTSMPHLTAIEWDHDDRMRQADLGGGGTVWFGYDSAGDRVRKTQVNLAGGVTRERIYTGSWEIWREWSAGVLRQELQTLHIGDDTGPVCLVETRTVQDGGSIAEPVSRPRFQHGNQLLTAALELDDHAEIISYEEYHPFGSTSYAAANSAIEVSVKRYRYIGKERDEETGLLHCGARYYASWLGRWTAPDPIGLGDGMNRYAYARGNPVTYADPGGLKTQNPQVVRRRIQAQVNAEVTAGTLKESDAVGELTKRLEKELGDQTPEQRRKRQPQGYTGYSPDTSQMAAHRKRQEKERARQAAQYDANKKVAEAVKKRDNSPAAMVAQETVAAFPVVGWVVDAMEFDAAIENYRRNPGFVSGAAIVLAGSAFVLPLAGGISRGLRHTDDVIEQVPVGAGTHHADDAGTAAPTPGTTVAGAADNGVTAAVPEVALGEIKPIASYRVGLRQLASRGEVQGNTALVTFDNQGVVHMQVFGESDGVARIVWEGDIGTVTPLPTATPGTSGFGDAMEPFVRELVEHATGQKFMAKPATGGGAAHGPDLLPVKF